MYCVGLDIDKKDFHGIVLDEKDNIIIVCNPNSAQVNNYTSKSVQELEIMVCNVLGIQKINLLKKCGSNSHDWVSYCT